MAGSGKGVLRIAIEDFFSTTKIGSWIVGWYADFIEGWESEIAKEYNAALTTISEIPELKGIFDPSKFKTGSGAHQGGAAGLLGFGLSLGMSAASSFLAPVMRILNYKMDQKMRSARLDPNVLISLNWKTGSLSEVLREDYGDLGYTPERVKAITDALRPLLGPDQLVTLYNRKLISQEELEHELGRMGFMGLDLGRIRALGQVIPGVQDLVSMAVREAWDEQVVQRFQYDANLPAEAADWAQKQGLSADWFKRYWRAHWQLPSVTLGYEMLHRLRPGESDVPFTKDDMMTLLRTADFPTFFRDRMIAVSYNPYTRVDVRRMHKLGVISDAELTATYKDLGYDDDHAAKLADWTIKNETTTETTKVEVARSLNQGTIVDAYQKKIIDRTKAAALLVELKYDNQEVEIILKAAEFQKVVAAKTDLVKSYNDKMRSEIISAYEANMLSKDAATTQLAALGYASDEVTFVLKFADFDYANTVLNDTLNLIGKAYINGAMTQAEVITMFGKYNISGTQQTALFSQWDTQRTIKSNRLTLTQYTSAWKSALIDDAAFKLAMADLGYNPADIDLYIKISTPVAHPPATV
jgi:hypothetical protein